MRWLRLLFWSLLLPACSRSPSLAPEHNAHELTMATLQPFLGKIRAERRAPSSSPPDSQVTVILANESRTEIPAPAAKFPAERELNQAELAMLSQFLASRRHDLGAGDSPKSTLELVNQFHSDDRTYVRFHQTLWVGAGAGQYHLKIQGADLIAIIDGGMLRQLRSHLVAPPDQSLLNVRTAIQMSFPDHQVATFVGMMKTTPPAYGAMKNYFEAIARSHGSALRFGNFLNRRVSEQRAKLEEFWALLNAADVSRLLLDASHGNLLQLAQYKDHWALELSSPFNLPVAFDLDLTPGQPALVARNLRLLRHDLASVHSFEAPHFPGGQKQEGTDEAKRAAQRIQEVLGYFQLTHGWSGYGGTEPAAEVDVYTQLTSASYRENAAWLASRKQFVVGAGGDNLFHLDDSISVLGHEFTHAIVQYSSALAYRGESGAINEHFADLQGATIEATLHRAGVYDYTVGADVLTPAVQADKQKILDLIFSTYHYQPAEKASFFLDRVALRHLYAPPLSFATQYDTVADARAVYPADCQPSSENDNCGVHTVSGVANRAASLIISALGLEETKKMFFRTVVYRLSQNATFAEYAQQLYEECQLDLADPSKCDVVPASFAAVGVQTVAGAPPLAPVVANSTPIPTLMATTPELKFCGWVKRIKNDNLQIFDDKFNPVFALRSMSLETKGDVRLLSHLDCACVAGRITKATDELNESFNAFHSVSNVSDEGNHCAENKRLRDKRPAGPPPSSVFEQSDHTLCGWVRVNSTTGDVVVVDNKFNVSLLKTPRPARTQGDFSALGRSQCACVTGRLAHTANEHGFQFNYLPQLSPGGIADRPYTTCMPIEWN